MQHETAEPRNPLPEERLATAGGDAAIRARRAVQLRGPLRGLAALATQPLLLGGATLILGFALLADATVQRSGPIPSVPLLHQIALDSQLFERILPHFISLDIVPYTAVIWAVVGLLWIVYIGTIWLLRDRQISLKVVISVAIVAALLAVITPPVFSSDVFSYSAFARIVDIYHANPYVTSASVAAPHNSLMPYLYWKDISSPYGPLWTLISEAIATGRHADPLDLTLRFKAVACAAVLIDGWLVYALVKMRSQKRATWAYLAFAWNPLVLVEGVVAAHNDTLILLLVLASAYLLTLTFTRSAFATLTASILLKYSTAPVAAVAGLRLLGRTTVSKRARVFIELGLLGSLIAIATIAPFWAGLRTVTSALVEPGRGTNNLLVIAYSEIVSFVTGGAVQVSAGAAVVIALVVFGLWQVTSLKHQLQSNEPWSIADELGAWSATLAMFLLLWPRIHTWYFLVPLGVAIVASDRHPKLFGGVIALSLLSYASYPL